MSEKNPKNNEQKLAELQQLWDKAVNKGVDLLNPEVVETQQKLIKEYGIEKCKTIRLWHLIIGSSLDETKITSFDTPTAEIEDFIRNKLPKIEYAEIPWDADQDAHAKSLRGK